jgi:hypothetical protein
MYPLSKMLSIQHHNCKSCILHCTVDLWNLFILHSWNFERCSLWRPPSHFCLPPGSGNHHSTLCLYILYIPPMNEIIQHLSSYGWQISSSPSILNNWSKLMTDSDSKKERRDDLDVLCCLSSWRKADLKPWSVLKLEAAKSWCVLGD